MSSPIAALAREQREAHGGTAKAFAELLGVSPQYLNDIERDRRAPGENFLYVFAEAMRLRHTAVFALAGRIGMGWRPDDYESAVRAMDGYLREL